MSGSIKKRWTLVGGLIGVGATLALVVGLGVFAGAGRRRARRSHVEHLAADDQGDASGGREADRRPGRLEREAFGLQPVLVAL